MKKVKIIFIAFVALANSACTFFAVKEVESVDFEAKNKLQLETLGFVFYENNPMPVKPSAEELKYVDENIQGP